MVAGRGTQLCSAVEGPQRGPQFGFIFPCTNRSFWGTCDPKPMSCAVHPLDSRACTSRDPTILCEARDYLVNGKGLAWKSQEGTDGGGRVRSPWKNYEGCFFLMKPKEKDFVYRKKMNEVLERVPL